MLRLFIIGGLCLLAAPIGAEDLQSVPDAPAAPVLSGTAVITTVSQKPNPAFPLGEKKIRLLAVELADQINAEAKQNEVGELLSYTCQAAKGAAAAYCDLKYGLHRDFCWFGSRYIRAIFELAPPHKVLWKTWGSSRDQ